MNKNLSLATQPSPEEACPIVGVGASAGGLEAFGQLLADIPEDTGMAYVLIQHLTPTHETMLSELLSKLTRLPIQEATQGVRVKSGHIYTIPPNVSMTIEGGALKLAPRSDAVAPFMPIDHFMHSLAYDQQDRAIGVILSGAGTDGTLGLEEIKAVGGITFAQNEKEAKYDSMPKSAILNGCVDSILPAKEIGQELTRIGMHPCMAPVEEEGSSVLTLEEGHYQKILGILHTVAGVDFTAYRDTTIKRRIMRRMVLHTKEGLVDYIALLEHEPVEVMALYNDLLINVTSFFREPGTFEALKTTVFPEWFKDKDASPLLRIWVPGCSTGQEAYSLAMALLEYLSDKAIHPTIQIFATDLSDEKALQKAREGLYPESIEGEVSPQRLQRFFNKENGRYRISKSIREMCVFAKHNVAADPPFSRMDLISCRNLLIYLALPLQRRVIPTFHYSLNPGGFLLLGASETIGAFTDLFDVVDQQHRIYQRKAAALRAYPHFQAKDFPANTPQAARTRLPTATTADWQREADRQVLGRYAPAGVLVNDNLDILQFCGKTSPYLESPAGEPSHNLLRMACEGLFPALRNAIDQCRTQNAAVYCKGTRIRKDKKMREIEIQVLPIKLPSSGESCFLVLFEEGKGPSVSASQQEEAVSEPSEVAQLRQEMGALHEYLQSVIEQKDAINEELRATNEEILSSNEEFQSTNEELETAKEELQSVNEELTTVNEQLNHRNKELNKLNGELKDARDYAKAIVETVREPLLVLDAHLRVQVANPAFYKFFRVTPERTENQLIFDLGNRQWDIPELRRLLESILPRQATMVDFEMRHTFEIIGSKTMLLNACTVVQHGGEPQRVLLAIENISERKWLEGQLHESTKKLSTADMLKNEFLATLAHELRNPLAPLRNALEILRMPHASAKMAEEARDIMSRQITQMVRLVDDLLDVSRITSGKIELRMERTELAPIVRNALEISLPLIEGAGHKLTVLLPDEPLWLQTDPTRLAQILCNLLNNAAKYTKDNGDIRLRAEHIGNEVVISVKDSGIGLPADVLPHIFEMFSQVDSSIERAQGGMGIGLALVKNLVELHGGSVMAQSEGAGKGSEFIIRLPLAATPDKHKH